MLPSILVSNKRAYRQLKDEALVAMRLTHPNIVTLRGFEENGGNPFLVMDYIDGQTLDDYLADNFSRVEHVERVEGRADEVLTQRHGDAEAQSGRAVSMKPPEGNDVDGSAGAHASSDIASQCSLRSGDMRTPPRNLACVLCLYSGYHYTRSRGRYYGFSVRPVQGFTK